MPATKSRISASSSTIKISAAMVLLACNLWFFWVSGIDFAGGGNSHANPGAPLAWDFLGGVAQLDPAAVLLDNASYDGKAETGALFTRRHIRLEQSVAVFFGQADTVVDNIDHDVFAFPRGMYLNNAFAKFGGRHCRNSLGRILDRIGQCL